MPAAGAELYDRWLVPNGIAEWVPEDATFRVDAGSGWITYTSFVWDDGVVRGWNHEFAAVGDEGLSERVRVLARTARRDSNGVLFEDRVVPLVVPVTDRVRELFRVSEAAKMMRLVEA